MRRSTDSCGEWASTTEMAESMICYARGREEENEVCIRTGSQLFAEVEPAPPQTEVQVLRSARHHEFRVDKSTLPGLMVTVAFV